MESKSGRTPPRYSPNPMQVSEDFTFGLRFPSGLTALRSLKWLMTKFYTSGKKYTDEEEVILHLIAEYWNSYRNKRFYQKHGTELLKLRLLSRFSLRPGKLEPHEEVQEKLVLSQRVLFSPRAFLSLPSKFPCRFLYRTNRRLKRKSPEPRRIGVGYRDKGTARVPSFDGNPSWGTVAVQPTRTENVSSGVSWWELNDFLVS